MKTYVKPELFYESYELSQHVAACRWDLNAAEGSCTASYDHDLDNDTPGAYGLLLFNSVDGGCNITPADREDYCYTNGAQGSKLFTS